MKRSILYLAVLLMGSPMIPLHAEPAFRNFITVRGDQLMDGDKPFRFISFNIPNLLIVEDNVPFAETNAWRLPDEFELQDALATVRQMGGTVVRTYSIPVWRSNDPPAESSYVLGVDKYNENAFRTLDLALKLANENGVRLIIPLVNNWKWQGGRGEYAGFRGKTADDFWTDPQLIADFERTIRFVLLRTNTLTGVRYCDDKAILCWETGNELSCPPSWTHEIARYIKSLDHNHLVMDGVNGGRLRPDSLSDPDVDIVTTHHYPSSGCEKTFAELIRENWAMAKGKKPYVVGEFGFVSTAANGGRHENHHGHRHGGRIALEPAFSRPRRRLLLAQRAGSAATSTRLSTGPARPSALAMTKSSSWLWFAAMPLPSAG